jgi:hypothetical protein
LIAPISHVSSLHINKAGVTWYHRDPLNLVARNTKPGQVKERVFAATPTGGQIETTAGVNLNQYYYGRQNNPECSGYTPQPPSG